MKKVLLVTTIIVTFFSGCGSDTEQNMINMINDINEKAKNDSIEEYNRINSKYSIQRCVHAALVTAAMLKANDSNGYNTWSSQESTDCRNAELEVRKPMTDVEKYFY